MKEIYIHFGNPKYEQLRNILLLDKKRGKHETKIIRKT